jgi:hypothetical protein
LSVVAIVVGLGLLSGVATDASRGVVTATVVLEEGAVVNGKGWD